MKSNKEPAIFVPSKTIEGKIYFIRGKKVMLDSDLAALYRVKTKSLNLSVRRNSTRFPKDFMFQLTKREFEDLISHGFQLHI